MIHYAFSKKAIDELLNEVRKNCKFNEEHTNLISITNKRFSQKQLATLGNLFSKVFWREDVCEDYITIYTCEGHDEMTDEEAEVFLHSGDLRDYEHNVFSRVKPYAEIVLPTKESGFTSPIRPIVQIDNYIHNNLVEHSDYELSLKFDEKTNFGSFKSWDEIRTFCSENRLYESLSVKTTFTYPTGVKEQVVYDYEHR